MKKGVSVIFYIIVILAVVVVLSLVIKPQEDAAKATTTTTKAKIDKFTESRSEDIVSSYVGGDYTVSAKDVIANGKMLVYAYGADTRIFLVDKNGEVEEIILDPEE